MSYQLNHEWEHEHARLQRLEAGMDPGTIRHLQKIGVKPGWNCLEVGAGAGSIAAWLADAVAPSGSVLATDLETGFVEAVEKPGLSVQQHNIVSDPLPDAHYDLIHSRAVLEHVPERAAALNKLVKATKPGGWLLLEIHDFSALQHIEGGDRASFDKIIKAMLALLAQNGFDPDYGRKVAHAMRLAGLCHVDGEARAYELGGDRLLTPALTLVLERLKPGLVAGGFATEDEVTAVISGLEAGDIIAMSPMVVAAWGQRPV